MSTPKPRSIEERLQQIQEALEQIPQIQEALDEKPDRDDLEHYSSEVLFKLEELQGEVAEVKDKVDDLESEDR